MNSSEKFTITPSELSRDGSLLLDIPLSFVTIPDWLDIYRTNLNFKPKDEYHVTVIGLDLATVIANSDSKGRVQALINNFSWTIEFSNEYIELVKDDDNGIHRQSIILLVTVPELSRFFSELNNILGKHIDLPPAHITLFTKNYDNGIGVYSQSDLSKYKAKQLT